MGLEPQGRAPPRVGGGRFHVVDTLGDGGTATVYLAWDGVRRRWCALKALQHKHLKDEDMRRRFALEAEALQTLRHPNVPELYAHDQEASPPYMVMELARCGSTMDWVRQHGPMPPSMAADVVFQVCEALAEAHAAGIVHRDVKPHNFLLDDEGRCKLTDFGIARVTDNTSMTQTGSQIGTFSFMAPEQRSDTKSVDHRADIYSIGASLYTLLTGKTSAELFVAHTEDELLGEIPPAYRDVILKATRYRPEERHASVLEFQTDLMNALSRLPPSQAAYPPLVRAAEPLPPGPPKVLPFGRRFEDLERSLGLDTDQPTYVPSSADLKSLEEEQVPAAPAAPRKPAIPYYMPSRPASTPPKSTGGGIPDYVADSEVGGLKRAQEWAEQEQAESAARERERTENPPAAPAEPSTLPTIVGGAFAVAFVGVLLVLGAGMGLVVSAASRTQDAAEELMETLQVDGAVVYELGADRRTFETIYQQYSDAKGSQARLDAALAFVEALDGATAAGSTPEAEPKVRRLQTARDEYQRRRAWWTEVAAAFPGSLAVRLGLARSP